MTLREFAGLPPAEDWEAKHRRLRDLMATWRDWPGQRQENGLHIVAHPEMGAMAVSPRYGHPVSVGQARRELAEKQAERILMEA